MTDDALPPSSAARGPAPDLARVLQRRALVEQVRALGPLRPKTLGPLGAVVFVLALLAAAVPNFIAFGCRSKQSEAKGNLKALWTARAAFIAEKGVPPMSLAELGYEPKGAKIRYLYALAPDGSAAIAIASPAMRAELGDDLWVVDAPMPHQLIDGCAR